MSKLPNIIQRREVEPLLNKADKAAKHYEKAANCIISVIGPDIPQDETCPGNLYYLCKHCKKEKDCCQMHLKAISEAKRLKDSSIYTCPAGYVFWTSPFFCGERFAGAFISGSDNVNGLKKNNARVKALANIMLLYANQVSGMSFVQQNITALINYSNTLSYQDENTDEQTSSQNASHEINSIEIERLLLANLRRGDMTEAKKTLEKLLEIQYQEVKHNFPAFSLKAIELAVLLSRAALDPNDLNDNSVIETNNRYLNKIEESTTFQEITKILLNFTEKMSGRIFSFQCVRHFSALRKAERYIWDNYTRKLSLQEIAGVSGLSAPYFSTIFKEEMGENLSNYLNRLRVEKAAAMLLTTNMLISDIAKTCGFVDQSWFSKIFKNNTGLTPGKYRDLGSASGLSA